MKATAIIDWLTFSVKGEIDPAHVITHILRMDANLFEDLPHGHNGYRRSMRFDTICVNYDPAEDRIGDMGICVSMSGNGCRHWEMHTDYKGENGCTPFLKLFEVLHTDERCNVSRVDLALDDRAELLDLKVIETAVDNNTINSRIRYRTVTKNMLGGHKAGKTVYIGSKKSDFRIRIYDKAKEHFKPNEEGYKQHWVRLEIVMRGENANGFVNCIVNSEDLGLMASAILNDKLAFIERDNDNISRCSICQWWLDFVDEVGAVKLVSKEEVTHKMEKKLEWVKSQIAPTLSLVNDAYGYFTIRDILKLGYDKRTSEQKALLKSHQNAYHIVKAETTN